VKVIRNRNAFHNLRDRKSKGKIIEKISQQPNRKEREKLLHSWTGTVPDTVIELHVIIIL